MVPVWWDGKSRWPAASEPGSATLVRGGSASAKAGELKREGIQIVAGDLTRLETLADACQGVDAVVCAATTMPTGTDDGLRRVDHDGVLALIDAAERAGAKQFVYTSDSGNLRRESALETAKRDCEARLLQSGTLGVPCRGCADGDVMPRAAALAKKYGVQLRSVEEYAESLRSTTTAT